MKIKILFFGITTDLVGTTNLELEVDNTLTTTRLKSLLVEKYPQLKNLDSYALAINESYVSEEQSLNEGDVVAIIPPVSGG